MKWALAVLLGILIGAMLAQAQSPAQVTFSGLSSSCVLPPIGSSSICGGGDKILLSVNGGAWVQLGGAGVQKVNGISPDATGNVTVPLPTTATVTLAGQTLTGTVK